ncbi:MAG: glycosyltransferase family 2 protein [Bacteroidetes bacterium]|nr:glycosyltransferase family 2 protein [Bacteroidota bacterium]
MSSIKYAIVIPAKNEEANLRDTIDSVIAQTIAPAYCLIVDDGSVDRTPDIVREYQKKHSFIHYYHNEGEKKYVLGGNVVRVFDVGKKVIEESGVEYDYIIKMDADISFDPDFMEEISVKIDRSDKMGIVSGTPYYNENGKKIYELSPTWHSHGQFKIYNRLCLDEIGGIDKNLGWDCADNIKAISLGWETAAFRDINYLMYRKVGGKSSLITGRINHGIGAYQLGYSFWYLLLRALHDIFKKPYLLGACSLMIGYTRSALSANTKRILDRNQILILRGLLWKSLSKRFVNKEFIVFQILKRKKSV